MARADSRGPSGLSPAQQSQTMPKAAWTRIDLTEPEPGRAIELPKPPGYSEQHANETVRMRLMAAAPFAPTDSSLCSHSSAMQEERVMTKKVDMMQLKLKVGAVVQRARLLAGRLTCHWPACPFAESE